jgi:hypothetical protein
MTGRGVNFYLPPRGQISPAVDIVQLRGHRLGISPVVPRPGTFQRRQDAEPPPDP